MTWWTKPGRWAAAAGRSLAGRAVHWCWQEFQRAGAITAGTAAGRAFKRFGRGSVMAFPPGAVFGQHAIEVGLDTLIGQQVTLTAGMLPGQDLLGLTVLSIGDRCVIGRGSHIVAHESVAVKTSRVVCTSGKTIAPAQSQEPDPTLAGPRSATTWWSRRAQWCA